MRELDAELAAYLEALGDEGLTRRRRIVEATGPGHRVAVDGRRCVAFCSNDYLGLAGDERISAALRAGARDWGTGAGAAHLVTGHTAAHHELERALATFTGRPRALLFSTGYMANLGVVTALAGRGDFVAEDRLNHASLIDAARLSGATVRRFGHADAEAAAARLAAGPARRRLVVTDGVFSMDGDHAPLRALSRVAAEQHNRAGDQPAAEDPVEFGKARRVALVRIEFDRVESRRRNAACRCGCRARDAHFRQRVPGAAIRALAGPLHAVGAALGANIG
jgi:8-amino-7-oxononanoate synthase